MSNSAAYLQTNFFVTGSAQTASNLGVSLAGSQPFTVSAWVQLSALQNPANILYKNGVFSFGVVGRQVFVQITGFPGLWSNGTTNPIIEDQWHYLTCVYTGNSLLLYIDGQLDSQAVVSGTGTDNSNPFLIGSNLQGNLNCVRVYNSALSAPATLEAMFQPDPQQQYAANFDFSRNPPADISGNNLPLTLTQGASVKNVVPGVMLTGNAYCQPIRDAAVNPGGAGNDAYTVQAWVYIENPNVAGATSAIIPSGQSILVNQALDSPSGIALFLSYDSTAQGYRLASLRGNATVAANSLVSNATIPYKRWVNVATTYNPATATLSLYINGTLDVQSANFPAIAPLASPDILIAGAVTQGQPSSAWTLQGYVQSVDVWNICLDAAAIAQWQDGYPVLEPGLIAHYDFGFPLPRDEVDGGPVGLADDALLIPQIAPAVGVTPQPTNMRRQAPTREYAQLPPDQMAAIRAGISFANMPDVDHLLEMAGRQELAVDLARFVPPDMVPRLQARLATEWQRVRRQMRDRPLEMRFLITYHKIAGDHVLIHHTPERSFVVFRAHQDSISDCVMWRIQVIWTVIAGLMSIFGITATLTSKAMTFIQQRILNNQPLMTVILNNLNARTATGVFMVLTALQSFGVLWPLIKIILTTLSWWALGRLLVKILTALFGTAAAVAETIAALVVAVAQLIIVIAQQPPNCPLIPSESQVLLRRAA